MKKVLGLVIAVGIISILFVVMTMVSSVTNTVTSVNTGPVSSVSIGWVSWFAGFSLWIGVILVALWMYLKHKKSSLTSVAGWAAILVLLFAVFGPERTEKIAVATGAGLVAVADGTTNFVTTGKLKSPAQLAEAHRTAVAEAARQAEIVAAADVATAKANARTEATDVRKDCGGRYAELTNCRNVYFGTNEKYFIESSKDVCPVSDPSNAGDWESLGGNQYNFIPYTSNGVRVTFFEMKVGETFAGYTCR
jgi:Sec-independent protein translocase protein TatA